MFPPFPTKRAHIYCKKIIEKLENGALVLKQVSKPSPERDGHGVMIGTLICKNETGQKIILNAVSGNSLVVEGEVEGIWVSPIVSSKDIENALSKNDYRIHQLTSLIQKASDSEKDAFLKERESLTNESLQKVYELYKFHCIDGKEISLLDICKKKFPPTGTGDCCAPKLLDYAFAHNLLPLSMDEIYYGKDSLHKKNGVSYPPCDERCALILPTMLSLHILYRDDDILVVNKPSGLLSVPGRGSEKQDCVVKRMQKLFPKTIEFPSVHRLDMETSGVMVLAFTKDAQRNISMQFEHGIVKKHYIALLDGILEKSTGLASPKNGEQFGRIELKFSLDWDARPKRMYDEQNGKLGVTEWEKLNHEWYYSACSPKRKVTRVKFTPLTGRTHQLRTASSDVHGFALPIVGDSLYGKQEKGERLMLHARYLSFLHPRTNNVLEFICEPDF